MKTLIEFAIIITGFAGLAILSIGTCMVYYWALLSGASFLWVFAPAALGVFLLWVSRELIFHGAKIQRGAV